MSRCGSNAPMRRSRRSCAIDRYRPLRQIVGLSCECRPRGWGSADRIADVLERPWHSDGRRVLSESSHITKDTLASLLRRQARRRTRSGLADGLDRRTVNYVHTILHRAFKDAVRWGRLARNPADAANPPRAGQKSDGVQVWDASTLRTFLSRSHESDDRLHAPVGVFRDDWHVPRRAARPDPQSREVGAVMTARCERPQTPQRFAPRSIWYRRMTPAGRVLHRRGQDMEASSPADDRGLAGRVRSVRLSMACQLSSRWSESASA